MLKRDYLIILFMSTVLLTLACLTSSALAAPKVGDLNGDGYIDSIDYRFMNRYILSKIDDFPVEDDLWVGDINKDDSIDTLDFAFLRKYLTGSIKTIEPIKLQLGSLEGETDSIVSLPLLLKNIPEDGLDKLKFELKFDNEVLEVVKCKKSLSSLLKGYK
ncbi:MAG: dockerin type I domain-containing protein [Bacillota bacterium]